MSRILRQSLLSSLMLASAAADGRQTVIVVTGVPGNREYAEQFSEWTDRWQSAAEMAKAKFVRIGRGAAEQRATETGDRGQLKQCLDDLRHSPSQTVWLVLIGHGTFDGRQAKFNLHGPDVAATELSGWLEPLKMPLVVVNCASASGPFINRLSAPDRVVVTATKSGYEYNFARFGQHISSAISDARVDLDKDGQVSILEAFLAASSRVAEFYVEQSRLATEHALLDDNGDGLGTPADWFQGFRAIRVAQGGAAPDGDRAAQLVLLRTAAETALTPDARRRRDRLELEIAMLRQLKPELPEDEYYRRLEARMLELARLYRDGK